VLLLVVWLADFFVTGFPYSCHFVTSSAAGSEVISQESGQLGGC
jgi:hypothetical protein